MSSIAEATPILLTSEERAEAESLVRSTKTEYRLRFKAQIVLMAANGAAPRAIARAERPSGSADPPKPQLQLP
jgi:hypothetical protein